MSRIIGERRFAPVAILAALLLGLGLLAGCGGDDGDAGDGAEQAAEQEPAQEEPADEQPADEQPADEEPADGAGGGDAAAGEEIFAAQCSTCHGPDGGGDTAPSLQGRQDLADDRSAVVDQVTNGGGGMPAFEGQLSEQEINDVATYVSEQIASQ